MQSSGYNHPCETMNKKPGTVPEQETWYRDQIPPRSARFLKYNHAMDKRKSKSATKREKVRERKKKSSLLAVADTRP
eukprot:6067036-Pleurochrysis_carterae.AAC.1